jgi:integrase
MKRREKAETPNEWYFKKYIDYRKMRGFSNKTLKKSEQAIDHLKAFLGDKSLHQLKTEDAAGFRQYLETCRYKDRKLSQNTIVNMLSQIKLFFEYLQGMKEFSGQIGQEFMGMLSLSPSQKQSRRNIGKRIKKFPKIPAIRKILSAIDKNKILGRRDSALISYLFLTGARISAAVTMRIGLLNLKSRVANQDPAKGVEVKFSKLIETTMPDFDNNIFELLRRWIKELKSLGYTDDDPLFPSAEANKETGINEFQISKALTKHPLTASSSERIIKECCRKAGYGQYHAHSFRDSHIYHALDMATNGLDIKAVSANVGHENVVITMTKYADMTADEVHGRILNLGKSDKSSLHDSAILHMFEEIKQKLDNKNHQGEDVDEDNQ